MRSEHFESTRAFSMACREYVALLHAMSKISAVQSMLRNEQRKIGEEVRIALSSSGKKEHLCKDLTRLTVRTSTRRTPVKKDYVIAEMVARFGQSGAENIWQRIAERRPVVETEKLAYESASSDDDSD
jgi:hypothetical protein